MPKRNTIEYSDMPIQHKNQALRMKKPYTSQDYIKHTVLTDDIYTYVSFYFDVHKKAMKFVDQENKTKYGDPNQYKYSFYWNQSEIFYKSAKAIDVEASPVAAYYCMLNAAKAYVSYKSESADYFVNHFSNHGIYEDNSNSGNDLSTICIAHKEKGVFPLFASLLDEKFPVLWKSGNNNSISLKTLLYNMAFIHRAYMMTYSEKSRTIDELFVPLENGSTPSFYKANDGKVYLISKLDKKYFSYNATRIPSEYFKSFGEAYNEYSTKPFWLISSQGAAYSVGSVSKEIKELNSRYRKNYTYIKGNTRMWYLKRTCLNNNDVVNLSNMTLIMAAMHRISEIARYKPEQLRRLLQSKENWLLHEFITKALDQFLDELASEITQQDIMCTGVK